VSSTQQSQWYSKIISPLISQSPTGFPSSFLFLVFGGTRVWTQGLTLLGRHSTIWVTLLALHLAFLLFLWYHQLPTPPFPPLQPHQPLFCLSNILSILEAHCSNYFSLLPVDSFISNALYWKNHLLIGPFLATLSSISTILWTIFHMPFSVLCFFIITIII
jgi:hypothetical protein